MTDRRAPLRRLRGTPSRVMRIVLTTCVAATPLSAQVPSTRPQQQHTAEVHDLWWRTDRATTERLMRDDLTTVVREVRGPDLPNELGHLLEQLNVLVRAGHRGGARQTIDRLARLRGLPGPPMSHAADFLIDRDELELARALLERAPGAEPGWGYVLVGKWERSGAPSAVIDRWLADRAANGSRYWLHERLRFRQGLGIQGPLLDSLAAEVRADAANVARAARYVEAATRFGNGLNLDWLGDASRPRLAVESHDLAETLARSRAPGAAARLAERSLALPYTSRDSALIAQRMLLRSAHVFPGVRPDWERDLRFSTKGLLAAAYAATGRADKAQPLIEELTALGRTGYPTLFMQLAGEVQRESGARVVEERISQAEMTHGDSSAYWVARARYWAGRGDRAEATAAYERALALSPPPTGAAERLHVRWEVARDYRAFLISPGDSAAREAAARLLWRELDRAAAGSDYAAWVVEAMPTSANDRDVVPVRLGDVGAARERLWQHLAARAIWGASERQLLWRLTQHTTGTERDRLVRRAVALATEPRAQILAQVLVGLGEGERAIPLMRAAMNRLPEGRDRDMAAASLAGVYLRFTTDWQAAESLLFPAGSRSLGSAEIRDRLRELALVAARAGARDDAVRLWLRQSNLDRASIRDLRELAATGPTVRDALVRHYRTIARSEPESWVPDAALRVLDDAQTATPVILLQYIGPSNELVCPVLLAPPTARAEELRRVRAAAVLPERDDQLSRCLTSITPSEAIAVERDLDALFAPLRTRSPLLPFAMVATVLGRDGSLTMVQIPRDHAIRALEVVERACPPSTYPRLRDVLVETKRRVSQLSGSP